MSQQQISLDWSRPVLTETAAPKRVSRKLIAAVVGVAAAATATTVFAVSRGHDDRSSFCHDYQALADATGGTFMVDSVNEARALPGRFRKLADEAPPATAADLRMLATDISTLLRTGTGAVDDNTAQAAADRVDAAAQHECG